jgi:hypothetical protein
MTTDFEQYGFTVVEKLIHPPLANFLHRYALAYEKEYCPFSDKWVPKAPAVYGDPAMEQLFDQILPTIERITGRSLYPTYAYFRVYHEGNSLPKHSDRPSCEISVSVSLGHSDANPWPLFIQGPQSVTSVLLNPGDGVVYKGCDCPHWRNRLTGNSVSQVFFHFVDQYGSNAELRFDKRASLNLTLDDLHQNLLYQLA